MRTVCSFAQTTYWLPDQFFLHHVFSRCESRVRLSRCFPFAVCKGNIDYHHSHFTGVSHSNGHACATNVSALLRTGPSSNPPLPHLNPHTFYPMRLRGTRGRCMLLNTSAAVRQLREATSGSNVLFYWRHLRGRWGRQLASLSTRWALEWFCSDR